MIWIRVVQRAIHLTPYTLHLTPYTLHLTPYALRLTPYATEATDRRIVRVPGQRTPRYIVIDLDSGFLGFFGSGFWIFGFLGSLVLWFLIP